MGLTAPLALLGLALVGLPIAAHLLRRADVERRTLPTVELLRRAAVESRRRVRVVDPWLLAARVALVVLGALALAGPFAEVEIAYGDGRVASVAIVLDDSMSMDVALGSGSRLDAARSRALEIVDALPSGSEVALVLAGARPRVIVPRTGDLPSIRALLLSLGARGGTARGSALEAGVELASRQLAGARHAVRRVVVLSDFAGPADGSVLRGDPGVLLEAERIGDETPRSNVGLTAATLDPSEGGALRLLVEARSYGDDAPARTPLEVRWRDRTLAETELTFERGVARTVLELPMPDRPEALEGEPFAWVSLRTDDALAADDLRAVLLRPASAARVIVVDGRPSGRGRGGGTDGTLLLREALALVPRTAGGPFVVRAVDPAGFLGVPVGSADVIFLAGVDLSSPALAEAVRAHHAGGAGLLWAAGPAASPGSEVRLSDLLPAHATAIVDGTIEGTEREAGADVLPPGATGLEHVRATRRTSLEPTATGRVSLRWSDGAPLLVAEGTARTAMLGVSLDATESDLPFRPGFVPLVARWVRALSRPGAMPDEPVTPGEVPPMEIGVREGEIELVFPSGEVVPMPIDDGRVSLDTIEVAGPYLARLPGPEGLAPSPRSSFVVAPPAAESDLSPSALPATDTASEDARPGRSLVERPLGPWTFLAVGLLVVVEGLARARRPSARSVAGAA